MTHCDCPMCQFQDGPCQSKAKHLGTFTKAQPALSGVPFSFTVIAVMMIPVFLGVACMMAAEESQRLQKINQEIISHD